MKKISLVFWMALFSLLFSGSSIAETMKIAYFDLPPHSMKKDGKHYGALIDYWEKYFAPEMGVELEWDGPLPPPRMLRKLSEGQVNAIALLAKNPERIKLYDFPDKPFFQMNPGIAVLADNPLDEITSINDIAGMTIGFFNQGLIPPAMQDPRIKWDKLSSAQWQRQNLVKLIKMRVDGAFNPESFSLRYTAKQLGYHSDIKVLLVPGTSTYNFPMFSKKDGGHFLNKYMKAQIQVDKQIEYKDLLESYLD